MKKKVPQYDYIIINDGSCDKTEEICNMNLYNYINLPINLGLGGAFQTGIKYALNNCYDACLQFDADGQHKPEYIDVMINKMVAEKCDIVIGVRNKGTMKGIRKIGSYMLSYLIERVTGVKLSDPTSGMRLYNYKAMKEIGNSVNLAPEPDALVYFLNKGFYISEVNIKMEERIFGKSYLSGIKSFEYMLQMFISIIFLKIFRR